jgi:integral membrane protein
MVTTDERDGDPGPDTPGPAAVSLRGSLLRYRVMAYATGVALLGLTLAFILKYAADAPGMMSWMGITHGVLYMIYLVVAVDLALKGRWSLVGTIGVLLAGTIPFLSFVAERIITHRVAEGRKL